MQKMRTQIYSHIRQRLYGNAHGQNALYEMPSLQLQILAKKGTEQGLIFARLSLFGIKIKLKKTRNSKNFSSFLCYDKIYPSATEQAVKHLADHHEREPQYAVFADRSLQALPK